eukprot:TRINITY_DN16853_c0_g2_i1.p1 TRINITY_DN16853_c0_g2~~TRINITY_DN16853_c0_g2_i1.p1  ORF type:complete len:381 (+),score=47.03 TRINITY_DN16853_c0_g2_i1:658-1800(+)
MSFSLKAQGSIYIDSGQEISDMYFGEFFTPHSNYSLDKPYDVKFRNKKRKRENFEQHDSNQLFSDPINQEFKIPRTNDHREKIHKLLKQKQRQINNLPKNQNLSKFEKPQELQNNEVVQVDWILMNKFKKQMRPKFYWENDQEQTTQNLFNNWITNNDSKIRIGIAGDTAVVIPAKCEFQMSNLDELKDDGQKTKYNIILMDPPWENKSVKHQQPYQTLTNKELFRLPVKNLACQDNCIVFVWVTNRPKIITFVKEELLPHWNLTYYTTWYWIKITDNAEFIYDLNSTHKKTYEKLIVAYSGQTQSNNNLFQNVPKELFIWSVPGQHSANPILNRFLKQFCPENGECMELFARGLAEGWTSWGNEVLKFQQLDRHLFKRN